MIVKLSDYIFEFISSKGIDTIFSVSGGASAHLLNSVDSTKFKFICNYHEQACAMAAEGYAKLSNKPACVLVTNGPGSSNTITGVLGAYQDSVPMVIVSGQVPTPQGMNSLDPQIKLRQLGVQECDIIKLVSPITKYAVQITDPLTVQFHLKTAYQLATTGRMGPVWLDIPLDIQNSLIDTEILLDLDIPECEDSEYEHMDSLIDLIFSAKRPIIVTGNGVRLSKSEHQFNNLKELLNIPIISTWTSKDLLSQDDELFVGNFGILGERAANFAVQNSDCLLILGSRLSIPNIGYQSHLFSPNSIKIMVDIDKNELKKHTISIDVPVEMDLHRFLIQILNNLNKVRIPLWDDWKLKTLQWKNKYPVFQPEYAETTDGVNSYYLMETLSNNMTDNHVVVTDMGTSFTCAMQSLHTNGKNRLFTSSGCCSMGFGLPGSIGAYYADPTKDVIIIAGDGGFQMNIQELQTIIHNKIPIKIFILNNNGYLAISLMQDNLFNGHRVGSTEDSGVSSPSFYKIATAYGMKSYYIETPNQLNLYMNEILSTSGPVLCEIKMCSDQLLIPRVQSTKNSDGEIVSSSLDNMFPYLTEVEMNIELLS